MPDEVVAPAAPEVPASRVVVTSENRAEFMAHKLDIAAPPPKAESAEPAKEEVKSEEAEIEAEPEKAEPKIEEQKKEEAKEPEKKHPIKERFSELTQQREAAKADAAKERERAEKAEQRAAELEAKLNPPKQVEEPTKPVRANFATDEEYEDARISFGVAAELAKRDKATRDDAARVEIEKQVVSWKSRVTEIQGEVPDYAERINASPVVVSDQVRDAIIESEVGPRLLLHLADNPEVGERLKKMTVLRALKEIGRLEAQYVKAAPKEKAEPKAEPKKEVEVSKAPAPITPLKGANAAADVKINAQGEFTGTYAEWKAQRKAGKIH